MYCVMLFRVVVRFPDSVEPRHDVLMLWGHGSQLFLPRLTVFLFSVEFINILFLSAVSVGVRCRKTVNCVIFPLYKLVIRIVVILENVGMFRLMVCNFVVLGENTCETSAQSIDELKDGLSSDLLVKQGKFSVALSVILGLSRTNRPFSRVQNSRAEIYTALHFNHTLQFHITVQRSALPCYITVQGSAVQCS